MAKTPSGYEIGDRVVLTCTFKVDGVLTDPTTVDAYIKDTTGTVSALVVTKDAVGVYSAPYDPTVAGDYRARFEGDSPAKAAHEILFRVREQKVVPTP